MSNSHRHSNRWGKPLEEGNRFVKEQRYYFGIGTVGKIATTDGENYYANLLNCQEFQKKVPIYLPDGGYIEQLDYEEVRKSINPPWQSSIRPISQKAFNYIALMAGVQELPNEVKSLETLKEDLKKVIRDFYVGGNDSAILEIGSIASAIAKLL